MIFNSISIRDTTYLVPVRVGPSERLIPPVDGVDVAVNTVVVAGVGAGRRYRLQTVHIRLGKTFQPGE